MNSMRTQSNTASNIFHTEFSISIYDHILTGIFWRFNQLQSSFGSPELRSIVRWFHVIHTSRYNVWIVCSDSVFPTVPYMFIETLQHTHNFNKMLIICTIQRYNFWMHLKRQQVPLTTSKHLPECHNSHTSTCLCPLVTHTVMWVLTCSSPVVDNSMHDNDKASTSSI